MAENNQAQDGSQNDQVADENQTNQETQGNVPKDQRDQSNDQGNASSEQQSQPTEQSKAGKQQTKRYRVTPHVPGQNDRSQLTPLASHEVEAGSKEEAIEQLRGKQKIVTGLPDPDGLMFDVEEM